MARERTHKLPPLPTMPPQFERPDLTCFTEKARRNLYDMVFTLEFTHPFLMGGHFRDLGHELPRDAADRAGLEVFAAHGRWFAVWRDLEADPRLPLDCRIHLVHLKADPTAPHGVVLVEL